VPRQYIQKINPYHYKSVKRIEVEHSLVASVNPLASEIGFTILKKEEVLWTQLFTAL